MNKEDCPYRMRIPIDYLPGQFFDYAKAMHLAFPEELGEFTGQTLTHEPVCTHKDAPFKPTSWGKDPYYCNAAVESGLCPLAGSRDEPKREKWEAVRV